MDHHASLDNKVFAYHFLTDFRVTDGVQVGFFEVVFLLGPRKTALRSFPIFL